MEATGIVLAVGVVIAVAAFAIAVRGKARRYDPAADAPAGDRRTRTTQPGAEAMNPEDAGDPTPGPVPPGSGGPAQP